MLLSEIPLIIGMFVVLQLVLRSITEVNYPLYFRSSYNKKGLAVPPHLCKTVWQ